MWDFGGNGFAHFHRQDAGPASSSDASVSVARVSTEISLDSATQDRILKQF